MFYLILKHIHSGLRWILFLLLIYLVLNSIKKIITNEKYTKSDRVYTSLTTILAHTQLLFGLILYFVSPKVVFSFASFKYPMQRFYLIEHIFGMLVAITFITIGSVRVKKAKLDKSKHARTFVFFFCALLIIIFSIPWPWNNLGAGWF